MANMRKKGKALETFWVTPEEKMTAKMIARELGISVSEMYKRPVVDRIKLTQNQKPSKPPECTLITPPAVTKKASKSSTPEDPKYLRVAGAAKRASVTTAFIYKLIADGRLKSHSIGKCRLIKVTDFDELIEGS